MLVSTNISPAGRTGPSVDRAVEGDFGISLAFWPYKGINYMGPSQGARKLFAECGMELAGKGHMKGLPKWVWRCASGARPVRSFRFWGYFYFGTPAGGP